MTVQELIEQLMACDLDAEVTTTHVYYDGDSDVREPYDIAIVVSEDGKQVVLAPNTEYQLELARRELAEQARINTLLSASRVS
jgi:hypothetical protein